MNRVARLLSFAEVAAVRQTFLFIFQAVIS